MQAKINIHVWLGGYLEEITREGSCFLLSLHGWPYFHYSSILHVQTRSQRCFGKHITPADHCRRSLHKGRIKKARIAEKVWLKLAWPAHPISIGCTYTKTGWEGAGLSSQMMTVGMIARLQQPLIDLDHGIDHRITDAKMGKSRAAYFSPLSN